MESVWHSLKITSNGTKESERQHLKQKDPDNEAKHRVKKKGENVTNRDSSNVLNISRREELHCLWGKEWKVESPRRWGGVGTLVLQEDASLLWHGRDESRGEGLRCCKAISQVWPSSDRAINLRSRFSCCQWQWQRHWQRQRQRRAKSISMT